MYANAILKHKLLEFWNTFGGKKNNGIGFSEQEKLDALMRCSQEAIPFYKQQTLIKRREQFQKAKQKLHSFKRFGFCFVCGLPASARHHIIQLQNGGINSKKNMVSLCDPCHAKIHPWLNNL